MQKFGFHESTVTGFRFSDGAFLLELEDVSCGDERVKVRVEVEKVSRLHVDSKPEDIVTMPAEDGEILSLAINDAELNALIEWNNFSTGESITHSYGVAGKIVNVDII